MKHHENRTHPVKTTLPALIVHIDPRESATRQVDLLLLRSEPFLLPDQPKKKILCPHHARP